MSEETKMLKTSG